MADPLIWAKRARLMWCAAALAGLVAAGCGPDGFNYAAGGKGPGGRDQQVALSSQQEVTLGNEAFQEVLAKEHPVEGVEGKQLTAHVTEIAEKIFDQALHNKPLRQEISISDTDPYGTPWNFNERKYVVLQSEQVNAFCLPGGKVAVFTGLLDLTKDKDDWLATVLGHEIAHAVAHHAGERIAREKMYGQASEATDPDQGRQRLGADYKLMDLLGVGYHVKEYARQQAPESEQPGLFAQFGELRFDRQQEEEADHIGVFLMAFANDQYDPEQAVAFWEAMAQQGGDQKVPEILSDHPSDKHRIDLMRHWAVRAKDARDAEKAGRIAPPAEH